MTPRADVPTADDPWTHDEVHRRPDEVSDATVAAVGKVSEAMEWLERARGRLYDFHQMLGHLDFQMGDAVEMLDGAGHSELSRLVDRDVVGRNVLDGRWTFQVIEEFEAVYYEPIKAIEQQIREELVAGRRHIYEAELKEQRRTPGRLGHESRPPDAHSPTVVTVPRGTSRTAPQQNT